MKLVSDGTAKGTRIFADDGNELPNVRAVSFYAATEEYPYAAVELGFVDVDVEDFKPIYDLTQVPTYQLRDEIKRREEEN